VTTISEQLEAGVLGVIVDLIVMPINLDKLICGMTLANNVATLISRSENMSAAPLW
jgi:hypothetical protein